MSRKREAEGGSSAAPQDLSSAQDRQKKRRKAAKQHPLSAGAQPKTSTHPPVPPDGRYPYIARPSFWGDASPIASAKKLYATIIQVRRCDPSESRPLVLITSKKLPIFEDQHELQLDVAHAFGQAGVDSTVRFLDGGKIKKWDGSWEDGVCWQGRIMGDLLGSSWKVKHGEPKWVVLPLRHDFKMPPTPQNIHEPLSSRLKGHGRAGKEKALHVDDSSEERRQIKIRTKHIDWEEIARSKSPLSSSSSIDLGNETNLIDRLMDTMFVSDLDNRPRTYRYVVTVHTDLNIMSPDPRNPHRSLLDGVQLEGDTYIKHPKQPIPETNILPRTNKGGWATANPDILEPESRFIIPELWQTYPFSSSIVKAASCVPAAMVALDDYLIALEFHKRHLPHISSTQLLLQAITNSGRVGGDVRRSYDRFEVLGDTVLKFITTLDVYLSPPETNLSGLLQQRQKINSNEELRAGVLNKGIVGYIRSKNVSLAAWAPEGWEIERLSKKPKAGDDEGLQRLGEKEIADVAEALIGASFLSSNRSFEQVIPTLQVLGVPLANFRQWDEATLSMKSQVNQSTSTDITKKTTKPKGKPTGGATTWMNAFSPSRPPMRAIGYTFKGGSNGLAILDNELRVSNGFRFERYKILGEAVLDLLVVEDIFDAFPTAKAEALADLKSARTSKRCQAAVAVHLDLFDHLKQPAVQVDGRVGAYLKAVRKARQDADRVSKLDQGTKTRWWDQMAMEKYHSAKGTSLCNVGFPSLSVEGELTNEAFGDLLQATLGAIFADSSSSLEEVRAVYWKEIKPFMDKYCGAEKT